MERCQPPATLGSGEGAAQESLGLRLGEALGIGSPKGRALKVRFNLGFLLASRSSKALGGEIRVYPLLKILVDEGWLDTLGQIRRTKTFASDCVIP